jgi:hypothetical protein
LCQYKTSPPQAMPAAGVAIFKGHFTIHRITKKTVALWVFLATGSSVYSERGVPLPVLTSGGEWVGARA